MIIHGEIRMFLFQEEDFFIKLRDTNNYATWQRGVH